MPELHLDVQGEEQIKAMLTGVGLDVRDLRGAMTAVGNSTTKYFSGQVFTSRGSVIGQPWQRLSDRYSVQKAKKYPGRPVLVRTGLMQRSFKHQADNMSVEIRNTAPHFKYHQSSETRYTLPRRAMIGIYSRMQSDVTATITKVLQQKIAKRAG